MLLLSGSPFLDTLLWYTDGLYISVAGGEEQHVGCARHLFVPHICLHQPLFLASGMHDTMIIPCSCLFF